MFFAKIANDLHPLTIFAKGSVFDDVWLGFEYASVWNQSYEQHLEICFGPYEVPMMELLWK